MCIRDRLSGMTGTASTEADEFSEIYGLNIVSVPTNKPKAREDYPDVVYKTIQAKYNAVCDQVAECHAKGQPVLVGTVSIEKSETLSKMPVSYTHLDVYKRQLENRKAVGTWIGPGCMSSSPRSPKAEGILPSGRISTSNSTRHSFTPTGGCST